MMRCSECHVRRSRHFTAPAAVRAAADSGRRRRRAGRRRGGLRLEQARPGRPDRSSRGGPALAGSVPRAECHAGYLAATGTHYGAATPRDLYSLPRIYCYGGESMSVFGERLRRTLAAAAGD